MSNCYSCKPQLSPVDDNIELWSAHSELHGMFQGVAHQLCNDCKQVSVSISCSFCKYVDKTYSYIYILICISISKSINYIYIFISLSLSIPLSLYLSIYLSACLSIHPSIYYFYFQESNTLQMTFCLRNPPPKTNSDFTPEEC